MGSPLFGFSFFNHLPPAVISAFGTGPMGQFGSAAVRTDGKGGQAQGVMGPAFSLARRRV